MDGCVVMQQLRSGGRGAGFASRHEMLPISLKLKGRGMAQSDDAEEEGYTNHV